jgi:DNA-binding transcriptional LysR family regulator
MVQKSRMFDWGDLRIFVAVAREGSTLAAAKALDMNQTTVARRIVALESALGVVLFDKLQSGYRLSAAGEELLPIAARMGQDAERLAGLAAQQGRRLCGTIRVTTNEPVANLFLTPALPELARLYPDICIQLIITDDRLDLTAGEADVAIRAGRRPTESGLVIRTLAVAAWSFYCSRDYAARRGTPADITDLRDHLLLGGVGNLANAPFMTFLAEHVGESFHSYSNSLTNHVVAIRAGLGVGALPCLVGDSDPELIRCVPPIEELGGEVMLVTRAELKDLPHIRAFNDFVATRIAAMRARIAGTEPMKNAPALGAEALLATPGMSAPDILS